MTYESELAVALEAVATAGTLVLEHYQQFEPIPDAPANITTATDHAAQELILQSIRRSFPADALCAEEQTVTLTHAASRGQRLWIVDPIDGTRGFAQKNGEFCIMVGFVDHGVMVVGAVFEPVKGICTFARKGGGCWRTRTAGSAPEPCRVGAAAELGTATVTQSRSKTARSSPIVQRLQPHRIIETYSAGVKLAQVASGDADIYVNIYPEFHDWDICAGHILVEEAGGKVTTLSGAPIRYGAPGFKQREGLVASNGLVHDAVLLKVVS